MSAPKVIEVTNSFATDEASLAADQGIARGGPMANPEALSSIGATVGLYENFKGSRAAEGSSRPTGAWAAAASTPPAGGRAR